jgi:uncharacterized protein (TIGR03663 family)
MTSEEYLLFDEELVTEEPRLGVLTVEKAAYAGVALLGAGLRLYQLGLRPLNEGEAVQALAALRFTQGATPVAPGGTVPALFTGNVVGFTLFGASDVSARWLPVLAGMILVLLPYWLRHRLGRGGALGASLFLALSPSAVYFSRGLDSAVLVATCGLALAVGLINYADTRRPGFLYLAALALGFGLSAGPGIYTLLLIFAAFALALYLSERQRGCEIGWSSLAVAWRAMRGDKNLLVRAGITLAATFGLAATALVLHPAGIGHAADLLGSWAQGFLPQVDGQPLLYPLLLLLRYEPLILLLGLLEASWTVLGRRGDPRWPGRTVRSNKEWADHPGSTFPHSAFLAFWASTALLIILIAGHRPAGNILLVVVPLALLAGQGVERAWRWVTARSLWAEAALFAAAGLGLLVFIYLQVTAYSQASPTATVMVGDIALYTTSTYLLLAGVGLFLLVGLGAVAWIWRGGQTVVAGCWLAALIALSLFGFQAAWGLSVSHATDARELMIVQATDPDVRGLVAAVEKLSLDEAGDAHTLPITVDTATGPALAWYLREFKNQTKVEGLTAPPDTLAAVTLAMDDPPIGETFRGQGFALHAHSLPWGRWGKNLIRWLLFTEGDEPVVDQQAVLWVVSQR